MTDRKYDPCPGLDRPSDDDGRCPQCGSSNHCAQCGRASSGYGHYQGMNLPFSCQTDERPVRKPTPLSKALARIATLEAALKPFAEYGRIMHPDMPPDTPIFGVDRCNESITLVRGDFRRAAEVLARENGG